MTDPVVSDTLKQAIAEVVDSLADQIRTKAADETRAHDVRILHTGGYHDAADYLRGAR